MEEFILTPDIGLLYEVFVVSNYNQDIIKYYIKDFEKKEQNDAVYTKNYYLNELKEEIVVANLRL